MFDLKAGNSESVDIPAPDVISTKSAFLRREQILDTVEDYILTIEMEYN